MRPRSLREVLDAEPAPRLGIDERLFCIRLSTDRYERLQHMVQALARERGCPFEDAVYLAVKDDFTRQILDSEPSE